VKLARMQHTKKPVALFVILGAVVIAIVVIALVVTHHSSTQAADTPKYQTILPKDDSIEGLGGWDRVSPPSAAPVYAYTDAIRGVAISVSQQPLPESFKNDTDAHLSELAKSYNATDKMNADGTTVYIGTSSKGPQSALFVKNALLVLIKSQSKIDDKQWITYIDSLQ
jgi:hypothetical protein